MYNPEKEIMKLISENKEYSEYTKKTYINNIYVILGCLKISPLCNEDLIKNSSEIIDFIENSKNSIYYKKILYVILFIIADKLNHPTKEIYKIKRNEYSSKIDEMRGDNKNTKRDNNYISWEKIKNIFFDIKENDWKDLQDKIIIGLYTLLPPIRNDYVYMLTKDFNNEKDNFIIKINDKYHIFLNHYKTHKTFGKREIVICDDTLIKLLDKWLLLNNSKYLLISYSGLFDIKPLSKSSFSLRFKNIMLKYTGKNITIQIIREIYESNIQNDESYNELSLNEKKKIHEKLLHSLPIAQTYRKINL